MSKRLKCNDDENSSSDCQISVDDKILSSDINNIIQATTTSTSYPYHTSVCGSLLYTAPTNTSSDIFSLLRHCNFDAFRRSLDIYYNDIIQMKNDHGQTVLHVLVIHAHQYVWIRLLMMRGCNTCAQDIDGYTAAHYAVERDDVEMLKALTLRFHSQAKPIPEERITAIHQQCINALSLKNKQGLTVFMLACYHGSLKCLNYLIDLHINDSNLEDKFGDTCLHYAVALRNQILVEKLINTCQANVNGGNPTRPSILDVLQYNREQRKIDDRIKDDQIEQIILSHDAKNRCTIRRITSKRKGSVDNDEAIIANLACISLDLTTNGQIETARSHARMAASLHAKGDFDGAQESYKQAMHYAPDNTIDWATYAFHVAVIHMVHGERQLALELLQKSLRIRKQVENQSQEIDQIQRAIDSIQQQTT
ncbi:unnamed protein product [Rotaria sp. Silwood1]|nr:unnamed protein product [Rotaria sp. Silwood1]CAF0836234.1 unnamed protein product [Rotaria sp. Silwood1]CAF3339901.1 unnamed protein product [Rotaria sp. Silwood1]CAF3399758.1 unnamed protein product [Rotaria sp. Silwood1]CAF3403554.1 unnamed protein product [Rotaria sp. Silwood1]